MEYKLTDLSIVSYFMRGIAIISVVCAHCNLSSSGTAWGAYEQHLLSNFGTIGVGMFLFCSGLYFEKYECTKKTLNRIIRYVVPWGIVASIVWLYIVVRSGNINLRSWFCFIIGYKSIYYYMTVYMIIQMVTSVMISFINSRIIIYILYTLLGLISILVENAGISIFPTPYLNFGVFISYFGLGLFLREYFIYLKGNNLISCFLFLLSVGIVLGPIDLGYWNGIYEILFETVIILSVFWLALRFKENIIEKMSTIYKIGRQSLAIYLWHIPFAGIISNLLNRSIVTKNTALIWPFIIIGCTVAVLKMIVYMSEKIGCIRFKDMIGVR